MWIIKGRRAIVAIYQDGRRDQFCSETCRAEEYSITDSCPRPKWPFTPMRFLATAHGSKSGVRGQLSTNGIRRQPAAKEPSKGADHACLSDRRNHPAHH